ncbi:Response regulator [Gammaproteobacteria bacterium]
MNLHILVVDDETSVADGVRAYLEDENMEVITMGSAESAIEAVRQGMLCDVCIMDMRLTGIDGNTAIRILAQLNPGLRFLIHTGSAGYVIPDDLRALGLTNTDLFFKPQSDIGLLAAAARRIATVSSKIESETQSTIPS